MHDKIKMSRRRNINKDSERRETYNNDYNVDYSYNLLINLLKNID